MTWRILPGPTAFFALLTVVLLAAPAQAVLTHRYSFTTNANDSVGSANWTANGGATFSGGQVNFDGVDDFLSLAGTPLPTSGSVTLEFWGTYAPTTAVGSRVFDFANNSGSAYMYFTPRATPGTPTGHTTDGAVVGSNTRWRWNDINTLPDLGPMAPAAANTGQEVLFTLVYDSAASTAQGNGEFRLYRDGSLVATDSGENLPILAPLSGTTLNRLGHGGSVPFAAGDVPIVDAPAFLNGSLNEFRIYNNPLSTLEVLTNLISGPDVTSVSFNTKTWSAAGASNWNTGTNWTANGVPAVGDRATIGNGGTATVSSNVTQAGALTITNGTLSVGAGGTLNVKYPIQLDTGDANSATINVTNGGVLAVGGILPQTSLGTKTINIDGGIIRPGFKSALVSAGANTVIGAGNATFDTPGTDAITWNSDLSGSGDVIKTGSGTLILRPSNLQGDIFLQNPNFTGEIFVNEGTLDVQREHGVFGRAGSTKGGIVHLNDAELVINTAYPLNFRKELPTDIVATGENVINNQVDRAATEIRMQGSISGDGTLRFTKPNLGDALGVDFLDRPNPNVVNEPETPILFVDNSEFTGRLVFDGNWAVRIFASVIDPDAVPGSGDETTFENPDFPKATIDLANAGAYFGKRGSSPDQSIELGGVAGVAGSRLVSAIAGDGDPLADVTYHIGGANTNPEFFGNVVDTNATDSVSVVKTGNNIQTFSGANTYSGTTIVNSGKLRVNGTHAMDVTLALPIGDYTVNAGGSLGGTGTIGTQADPVNVAVSGGAIAPESGMSTGEPPVPVNLTVNGNVTLGANGAMDIEVDGAASGKLSVIGNLDLNALGNALNVTGSGTGSWVIATYTGSLFGTFESITSGLNINYGTGTNSQITISGTLSSGALIGDYNGNGTVDAADYTVWRNNVGNNGSVLGPNRDPDNSGNVGPDDYASWKQNFGATGPGAGSLSGAVPEPTSLILLLVAAACSALWRRR